MTFSLEDMSLLMNLEKDEPNPISRKAGLGNPIITMDFDRELPVDGNTKLLTADPMSLGPEGWNPAEITKQTVGFGKLQDSSKNSRRYHLINQSTRSKEQETSIPRKARPNSVLPIKKGMF